MPATASIRLNSVATPNETYKVGDTVTLSNNDNTGVSSWGWTLLAKPTGSAASLASLTTATTTFIVDVEGSYLARLVVNASLPDEDQDTAVGRVLHQHTATASFAKDETGEGDPTEGWARRSRQNNVSLDQRLGLADRRTVRYVGTATTGPKLLTTTGTFTLPNGDIVPTVDILSTGTTALDVYLWDGGALATNAVVSAIRRGLSAAFANPDTMVANDPVYLGSTGALTKTLPTADRAYLVGYCVAVSGLNVLIWFEPLMRFNNSTLPLGPALDATGVAGTSQQVAHADHQHPLTTYASVPTVVDSATGAAGTSATAPARGDHKHALATYSSAPLAVAAASAAGASPLPARGDHVHAHGDLAGGALHAAATTSVAGFLSAADKALLEGLGSVLASKSHVHAFQAVAQSIATGLVGGTTAIFGTEDYDANGEYNPATGIYTAKDAGYVLVCVDFALASAAWLATNQITLRIIRNNGSDIVEAVATDVIDANVTRAVQLHVAKVVKVAMDETIRAQVAHNQGAAVNSGGTRAVCSLTIDRIL